MEAAEDIEATVTGAEEGPVIRKGKESQPSGIKYKNSGTARAVQAALGGFLCTWLSLTPLLIFGLVGVAFLIGLVVGLFFYFGGVVIFAKYRYCILPDRILMKNGVISKNYLDIPMIRVQSISFHRTPVEKFLGVGSIKIETAGAMDADAWIYSIRDYDSIGNYILHRSEETRLANDLPKMERVAPEVLTVRAFNEVEAAIGSVFGKTDQRLRVTPVEVMNRMFHMSPKMKLVWGLEASVLLLSVWGLLCIPLIFIPDLVCGLVLIGLLVIFLAVSWVYAEANYHNYTFHFERDALTIRHGIFIKNKVKLPYKRIQNINLFSSFFGRRMGLHSLIVETGGGSGVIHGIEEPDPVVYFLLEKAEDARFDDALGDATELEDYHFKVLKQIKKVNYRLKERIGRFDNPFDQRTYEVRSEAFMDPRTEPFFIIRTFSAFVGVFNLVAIIVLGILISSIILLNLLAYLSGSHPPLDILGAIPFIPYLVLLPIVLSIVLGFPYSIWYGRMRYKSYLLRFDYDSLFSRSGVWTINDEMVPYRRIQNAYITQSLLEGIFGIRSVYIHAPGMMFELPGVKDPEALVAFILRKAEEARVDEGHDMDEDVITAVAYELRETDDILKEYLSSKARPAR